MNQKKSTEYLNQQLYNSTDIETFLTSNTPDMKSMKFSDYLYYLLDEHGLKYADILKHAQLSESYGYQLLSGRRQPSRDKVLQIVIAAHFSLQETNRLLKLAGRSELYVKEKRDAVMMFAISCDAITLLIRAFSTFKIFPLSGSIAWNSLFLPCFALPPAEFPSTKNNSFNFLSLL
jgi:hypothetical protein